MSARVILLVGMMGAGKSSVGEAIGGLTGWPYVDNDELVEQTTGRTPPGLLAVAGEQALRTTETQALLRAMALSPPAVAGLAGGTVLDPANRARLRAVPGVVWLRARPDTLIRRVGDGAGRPWLQPDPAAAISRLVAVRDVLYAEVADIVIDVDELTAAEAAAEVLEAISGPDGYGARA